MLVAFLYWKPAHDLPAHEARAADRAGRGARAPREKEQLETRIAQAGTGEQLVREARRLGLVKPGEQLFIVKGIAAWRKKH